MRPPRPPIAAVGITALVALQMILLSNFALATDLVGKTSATFNWTAASGPVVEYAVFVDRNGTGFPGAPEKIVSSTSVALTGSYGNSLVVRVAARDAAGNQGPFSPSSDAVYFVEPPPALSLSVAKLTASTALGGSPANQTFSIANSGESTLAYSVSADANWLSVSPSSGTAASETDTITVSFAAAALAAGNYNATITVSATGLPPQTIDVHLSVSTAPGSLTLSKTSISSQVTVSLSAPDQHFVVGNVGGSALNYTVTPNEFWVTASPSSGTLSPSAKQTITLRLNSANLNPGLHSAIITVNAAGANGSPKQITLTLEVSQPLGAPGTPTLVLVTEP